jgi:ubiquinone/menaquinone biosynthesis C-methylase UbiE
MKTEKRDAVKGFYSEAALKPRPSLCSPEVYGKGDVGHIPKEIIEISYGCGSPVRLAAVREGEVVLDLGSGGGIDCFVAAKVVGARGSVIGVDMTGDMLDKARAAAPKVAKALGYANVVFKEGFLEDIPVEDDSVDLVLSNCVVNLADDKARVMVEVMRVLRDRGRFCISDVVAEEVVPEQMRDDDELWGECISGALKEDEFMETARSAGAYGLEVLSRSLYRVAEGIRFYSIVLRGYKFVKGAECLYRGHFAIYNGPFSKISDDDGHNFPAGVMVEICTDTLEKLQSPPYKGFFSIIDTNNGETALCVPQDEGGEGGGCC